MKLFKQPHLVATILFATIGLLATIPSTRADEPTKPLALHGVMQQLGRNMQDITGAISKENWALIAQLAPKIAHHPEPPLMEKMRILTWLGTDAGKFRALDRQVHQAATALGDSAKEGDGHAVIAAFSRVQQGCLACHQSFRKSFRKHFYGQ